MIRLSQICIEPVLRVAEAFDIRANLAQPSRVLKPFLELLRVLDHTEPVQHCRVDVIQELVGMPRPRCNAACAMSKIVQVRAKIRQDVFLGEDSHRLNEPWDMDR